MAPLGEHPAEARAERGAWSAALVVVGLVGLVLVVAVAVRVLESRVTSAVPLPEAAGLPRELLAEPETPVATGDAPGFTREEMDLFGSNLVPDFARAELSTDPAARKKLLDELRTELALVAEAQRRKLDRSPKVALLTDFAAAMALAAEHSAKQSGQRSGFVMFTAPSDEIAAWKEKNGDRLEQCKQALSEILDLGGLGSIDDNRLASAFVFADKARAEGLDEDPVAILRMKVNRYSMLGDVARWALRKESEVPDADLAAHVEKLSATGELDEIHARQILIATAQRPDEIGAGAESSPGDPRALAENLLRRVRQGDDFAALATQYSDDLASKINGGDLGILRRGALPREVEDAIWKLQPGQSTDVVQSPRGYHIVEVVERRPPGPLTPERQQELKSELSKKRLDEKIADIVKRRAVRLPEDFTVSAP